MELKPIKTRILQPPQDNIFDVFAESLTDLRDGDIVLVTSKVVAIHQGRCVLIEGTDKAKLVREEADYLMDITERKYPMTIKHHAFISAAGIDESNSNGYYTLLPKRPFEMAEEIHTYLKKAHTITKLGVIITDSHSLPFRYGAMSIAISFWGFEPIDSHKGKPDLFGRLMHVASTNQVDSLAAASALVSGECAESSPIVIARNVPNITYSNADLREKLLIPKDEDLYRYLYDRFKI